ncbi:MAG: SLC13 family permease [Cellvibrionaceae bacterium]|nr:SLC13 family permease [Cellvibrionaceae bacterium]
MSTNKQNGGVFVRASLWFAPLAGSLLAVAMFYTGWQSAACLTAGVTVVCAVWWIFEPIPIPATSLIPLGVFPLFGVLTGQEVAQAYGSPLILLLMGGAMLSKAMEKSGAHRRVALGMVKLFGGSSYRRLVFGFMAASAVLSMWISNTATTLMLLPVALAILEKAKDQRLAIPLLLGIAYSASIGGMGTPIGTTPNVIFINVYKENTGIEPTFFQWMGTAIPVVLALLPLAAWWLTRNLKGGEPIDIPHLGAWRSEEKRVLGIFALTAVSWMTLKDPWGGWSTWFNVPTANYAAVALTAVVLLFVCPSGEGNGRLLDWQSASSIQWGVLILFAGGIAIAKAFVSTGISEFLGNMFAGATSLPKLLIIFSICLGVTFLTEITSNTATTALLMPILAAAALGAEIDPALLMMPAALSASCAFMLPVATAPNAIVFGTGRIQVRQMLRQGFGINLMGSVVIALTIYFLT